MSFAASAREPRFWIARSKPNPPSPIAKLPSTSNHNLVRHWIAGNPEIRIIRGAIAEFYLYVSTNRLTVCSVSRDARYMHGPPPRASTGSLAWLIARDSSLTFGGGTPTAEALRRTLGKRGWLSADEHRRLFAISRLTPGTNLLAYCTAVGWHVRGSIGALAAWLASSIPSSLLAVAATAFYARVASSPIVGGIVLIGTAVALLLLLASAWHLARPQLSASSAYRTSAIVLVVVALVLIGLSPVAILLIVGAIGAAWSVAG